jgi:hypothetical protein
MALTFGDRVQEIFTTTGTGSVSLAGAIVGYQPFSAIVANNGTCYYAATDGTNWEVGLGTYIVAGNVLQRTTILASSNGGAAVSWAAGTKNIWIDLPAAAISTFINGLVVGTTPIIGGTNTNIEYNNNGVVGEYSVSGTGSVAMTNSPAFVTPALGTPASGNLQNCTNGPQSIMTAGGVGSVGMFFTSVTVSQGSTTAGSNLYYYGIPCNGSGEVNTGSDGRNGNPSGTWQALQPGVSGSNVVTMWQRTA